MARRPDQPGTLLAARALSAFEAFDSQARGKKNVVAAVERLTGTVEGRLRSTTMSGR